MFRLEDSIVNQLSALRCRTGKGRDKHVARILNSLPQQVSAQNNCCRLPSTRAGFHQQAALMLFGEINRAVVLMHHDYYYPASTDRI
jgi:hypothetical protein